MSNEASVSNANDDASSKVETPTKETVSYDTHAKLLKQRKSDQTRMQELESKLAEIEKQKEQSELVKLEEQKEYKTLADTYKVRAEEAEGKIGDLQGSIKKAVKTNAFLNKLPGKIKRPEYREYIPIDSIVIDPETGEVEENSLGQAVESFMNAHGKDLVEIPGDKRKMPSVPHRTATTTTNTNSDIKGNLQEILTKLHNKG